MSTFLVNKLHVWNPFAGRKVDFKAGDSAHAHDIANRAAAEIDQGDFEKAERLLRKGLAQNPTHTRCLAYMAVCTAALADDDGTAEEMARKVINRHPEDPAGWFALAQVHLLGGNRKIAFQHFAKARELAKRDRRFRAQIDRQDPRNSLAIRTLPRDHVANVILGRVRNLFRWRSRKTG